MGVTLLDPTAQAEPESLQLAARPESLSGKRLGLIENTKQNASELLEAVYALLQSELQPVSVIRRTVPATALASDSLLDELARDCDLIIEAVGD